jgi:hypothetical protein
VPQAATAHNADEIERGSDAEHVGDKHLGSEQGSVKKA